MNLFPPKYVFDTGPFIDLNRYPKDIFVTLWDNLSELAKQGVIISSFEVYNELQGSWDDDKTSWANEHKGIFMRPSISEQLEVQKILSKFPNLLKQSSILIGKPEADPYVIAQAKINNCILVHTEKLKPNAPKIPNVCQYFGVENISLFDFFRRENWQF